MEQKWNSALMEQTTANVCLVFCTKKSKPSAKEKRKTDKAHDGLHFRCEKKNRVHHISGTGKRNRKIVTKKRCQTSHVSCVARKLVFGNKHSFCDAYFFLLEDKSEMARTPEHNFGTVMEQFCNNVSCQIINSSWGYSKKKEQGKEESDALLAIKLSSFLFFSFLTKKKRTGTRLGTNDRNISRNRLVKICSYFCS